jgi:hypothetical protein
LTIKPSVTPVGNPQEGNRISAATKGGIAGAVVGAVLIVASGLFYFLWRRKFPAVTARPIIAGREETVPKMQARDLQAIDSGNLGLSEDNPVGGRLRYPDETITDGGRLASF